MNLGPWSLRLEGLLDNHYAISQAWRVGGWGGVGMVGTSAVKASDPLHSTNQPFLCGESSSQKASGEHFFGDPFPIGENG